MGIKLDVIEHEGIFLFLTAPAARFPVGDINFNLLYEYINPGQEEEYVSNNLVGFEILDIDSVDIDLIPDIQEKFDVPDLGFRDMTIKEIVLELKNNYKSRATS